MSSEMKMCDPNTRWALRFYKDSKDDEKYTVLDAHLVNGAAELKTLAVKLYTPYNYWTTIWSIRGDQTKFKLYFKGGKDI